MKGKNGIKHSRFGRQERKKASWGKEESAREVWKGKRKNASWGGEESAREAGEGRTKKEAGERKPKARRANRRAGQGNTRGTHKAQEENAKEYGQAWDTGAGVKRRQIQKR